MRCEHLHPLASVPAPPGSDMLMPTVHCSCVVHSCVDPRRVSVLLLMDDIISTFSFTDRPSVNFLEQVPLCICVILEHHFLAKHLRHQLSKRTAAVLSWVSGKCEGVSADSQL